MIRFFKFTKIAKFRDLGSCFFLIPLLSVWPMFFSEAYAGNRHSTLPIQITSVESLIEMSPDEFSNAMLSVLDQVGRDRHLTEFIQKGKKAFVRKGYRFVNYASPKFDEMAQELSGGDHLKEFMERGLFEAATDKTTKLIVVDIRKIVLESDDFGIPWPEELVLVLVNEWVHIISDVPSRSLDFEDVQPTLDYALGSGFSPLGRSSSCPDDFSANQKRLGGNLDRLQKLVTEDMVSEVVSEIVFRRRYRPNQEIKPSDFRPGASFYDDFYFPMKLRLPEFTFEEFFRLPIRELKPILERYAEEILLKGEIENEFPGVFESDVVSLLEKIRII